MPTSGTIKMTAGQFLQLGEDPAGVRLELVEGEISASPSPTPAHSYADRVLSRLVGNYISDHDLGLLFGDVDTVFGDNDVRRPDIIYFSNARAHLIGKGAMQGPPDLCVEIVSPGSSTTDRVEKFAQYEAGGVLHYWIVDTHHQSIEGYVLKRGKYVLAGSGRSEESVSLAPFADLKIPLGRLWLKLPPVSGKRRRGS